ncbi:hypothetical protein NP493_332g03041 [Ridgeia piscesae]|uniref:Uncharacterized protein n=1 Tax=Ridgeia piscesae TaxID=27915 RepID=A0AAD9NUK3_RIDPI|nr:hypothetical protein NP493_332g03041 [Ridgeia piscesae]
MYCLSGYIAFFQVISRPKAYKAQHVSTPTTPHVTSHADHGQATTCYL